ncbi:MAG: sigma 54-interacting transcriptional regulator, partial [Myxococcales bacterium]|nr:sigma 54-interacting transcriptional regulator [Myxococcales bacterium]
MSEVFASMGRAILLLDSEFRVLSTGRHIDHLVCAETADHVLGHHVNRVLSSHVFTVGGPWHQQLLDGERFEGRSAFIRCAQRGAQLVSVSVTPVSTALAAQLVPGTRFIVVVRAAEPADDGTASTLRTGLMASSTAMLEIVELIEVLSDSEATVLVTGETGTGKGVVAAAIHAHSPRREGPFVTVDAGALPAELLESELF